MSIRLLIVALALAVVGGCAVLGPSGSASPVAAPPSALSLAAEQRRLAELFRGTPVVFAMQSDRSMRVTVPLRYSFDSGASVIKPPLAAVLDRIAKGQRDEATRLLVAAPADPPGHELRLASERASHVRDYLASRGIDAVRLSLHPTGRGHEIVIVVDAGPLP